LSKVIISTKEKVFHEEFCPYVTRIQSQHRRRINEEKAIEKGYCECKFCRSVKGLVYKYRQLSNFDICYDAVDDALCVRTDVGFWKLIWREQYGNWVLFHMNHRGYKMFNPELPSKILMRGSFHRQEDFKATTSVAKALQYIESHDKAYRLGEEDYKRMPKNTQKQRLRYRQQRNRKQRESIHNVLTIINNLEKEKK
jgi:hypothetical protein